MYVIRSRAHRLYAASFVVLLWCWPFFLASHLWLMGAAFLINTAVYITVACTVGSNEQSFWRGLCALAASFESGCINLTFLYIYFVLAYYYILMILATYAGLRSGSAWTKQWWIDTVSGRFASEEEYQANLQRPRWFG
jgi:hypothetical protein